jgi:hypothetical protein
MRAKLVGHISTFRRQFSVGLLFLVGVSACDLLKKKGDTGPDAQASAATVITNVAPLVEVPSVAPVASVLPQDLPPVPGASHTHAQVATSTATKTTPAPSGAPNVEPGPAPIPAPGPAPIPAPGPNAPATATPTASPPVTGGGIINPQCLKACQQSYQDCVTQSGSLSGMALITKCREVLTPCLTVCK